MQTTKFNAGNTILAEGEEGDTAFLIITGSVEVSIGEIIYFQWKRDPQNLP